MSSVTRFPAPCSKRPTFFPSLPSVVPLETFLIAFIIPLQTQLQVGFGFPKPTPAYSDSISTVLLDHLTISTSCIFFFFLSFVKRSLFVHAGLLPPLLNLLLSRVDHRWAWRRRSLKINQLSWSLILSRTTFHGICPSRARQSLLFPSLGLGPCYLSYSLPGVFWTPPSCVSCSRDSPWCSQPWLAFCKARHLAEHLPSSAPSGIYIKKLSSPRHSSLDGLGSATVASLFQCISGWWKSPMITRTYAHGTFSGYLKKASSTSACWGSLWQTRLTALSILATHSPGP